VRLLFLLERFNGLFKQLTVEMKAYRYIVSVWVIPIGGLITSIFCGWVLDKRVAQEEFTEGNNLIKLFRVWHFFLKWIVPILILAIIFQKTGMVDFDRL
jgi:NSS family neurotransmitter:Na+ symporter